MHVPSVSDYKTNRGGEKKKREREKTASFGKLHPTLSLPPTNAKIEFLPHHFFLTQTCCFATMSKERPFLTNLQRRTILFSLDSISIPLVNERFEARSFNAAVKNRMLRDSRALPNQQLHPPGRGGGRSIYLAVRVLDVYTRGLQLSLLTLMGRQGTAMGVGESTGWSSGVPGLY